jgi:ankyrin repeat protein
VTLETLPYKGAELLYRKDLPVAVVRKLLHAGVNVDGGGAFESTPLVAGCGCVHWGTASVLLEFHADVHRRGAFGMSVLHNPRLPVWLAEQFRRRGADVNARDMLGETPLMLACAQGNLPLVRWLVSQGARPDDVATDLRTMADYAAIGGPAVTNWLVRHGQLGRSRAATAQSPQC